MATRRLLAKLRHWLSGTGAGHDSPCAQLDALLQQLERHQARLRAELAREARPAKRRRLGLALQVACLQHRKGLDRRLELGGDCN
jgi:hypothetical protein